MHRPKLTSGLEATATKYIGSGYCDETADDFNHTTHIVLTIDSVLEPVAVTCSLPNVRGSSFALS